MLFTANRATQYRFTVLQIIMQQILCFYLDTEIKVEVAMSVKSFPSSVNLEVANVNIVRF